MPTRNSSLWIPVTGPAGPAGPQGPQGPAGPAGAPRVPGVGWGGVTLSPERPWSYAAFYISTTSVGNARMIVGIAGPASPVLYGQATFVTNIPAAYWSLPGSSPSLMYCRSLTSSYRLRIGGINVSDNYSTVFVMGSESVIEWRFSLIGTNYVP